MKKVRALDIKYALTQVLYLGGFCALLGYASVYLLSQGVSNATIGVVLASISIITAFTQPMMASFADQHPQIELRKLIGLVVSVAIILSVLLYVFHGVPTILILLFVSVATLLITIQPLLNALAFIFEKYGIQINYGIGRGLGSASYALVSFALGHLVEAYDANLIPLVYIIANALLVMVVYGFVIPKNAKQAQNEEVKEEPQKQLSFFQFCKTYQRFMIFILGVGVVFFTHTIINNFFIQIITYVKGTASHMGTAVFIAAMVELPAMGMFDKIKEKISCRQLLMVSAVMFALKHTLTYLASNVMMIYIAQVMQIGAYAILIPASVYYVNEVIGSGDVNKGQSMVTTAIAASGIVANLVGGVLLDELGVHQVLLIGVVVSIIGALIVILALRQPQREA